MLKKCTFRFLFTLLAMAGMSVAAYNGTPTAKANFATETINSKTCYKIGSAEDLYGFAAIVNGTNGNTAEPTACGVLTADIVVNEHVLDNGQGTQCVGSTGSYNKCGDYYKSLYTWTPIGDFNNSKPFQGTFDGLGHTISGLYDGREKSYTGLFGYVSGTNAKVSIKNVGVEDSYFRVKSYAGGIVGMVSSGSGELNIENVYSASTFYINGDGYVGGLLGRVGSGWTLNITNAYNSGSIFGTSGTTKAIYVAGLAGYISSSAAVSITNAFNYGNLNGYAPLVNSNATVTNSFYLGDAVPGSYGVNKSASDFSDGSVFAALRSAEGGSVWHQYQGDSYPSFAEKEGETPFVPHSATLHYSSTESETIYFVEGLTASLPIVDKSENPVLGWYDNEGLTGTKYTEIPASANRDLSLYPKVMKLVGGCYEISDADMLYAFAAAVNNGNAIACGKLAANIVVNQNVLTTADGTSNVSSSGEYIGSNSASFRQWTPIGYNYRPFKGTFDGQGHTISGLYFNDPSSSDVGLFSSVFGDPKPVTIENVGLVDSYFRGNSTVGGLVGNAKGLVTIKNSFNAGSINAQGEIFGGLVGYSWKSSADVVKLTISNSYNTGSLNGGSYGGGLVGSAVDLIISNSYNTGSVTVSKPNLENGDVNCVGGFAASADKVTITNSYNYGSVSSPDGARKDDFVTSFDDGSTVTNSFFISECDFEGKGATKMSSTQFADGTVLAALRDGEGGYVWVQAEGDKYPTIDVNASTNAKTIVLDWTSADDSTTLDAAGYTDGAMVIVKDGKQFYAGGAIYEGILSAGQVAAIGSNKLYPISGVELETDDNSKLIAILDGNSKDMLLIPTEIPVDKVVYKRDISANDAFVSIMLPFKAPLTSFRSEYTFYKFKRMAENDNGRRYVVKVSSVKEDFLANTPYITKPPQDAKQIHIVAEAEGLVLQSTIESPYEISTTTTDGVKWTMKGVYEYKTWETGDSELGKSYGFAAQNMNDVKIGEFAKLGAGASILPMRMYLVKEMPTQLARPGFANGVARINELPETIAVEFEDEEEGTMLVKRITVAPTVIKSNSWFDMKGRSLGGKPTAKGTYYHNGQKIIIK